MARRFRRPDDLMPGRLYSRPALIDAGMHPRVLSSPAIVAPLPGYCARADAPVPLIAVAQVLQNEVRPGAVISHTTALELLGLPLPQRCEWSAGEPLHCRASSERQRSVTSRIIVHAPRASAAFRWKGIVLSHPLVALQDSAQFLGDDDLVVCLDALAGTKAELTIPLPGIRAFSGQLRGRGAASVRRAAELAAENVWSPMETRTRLLLSRWGYPLPVANLRIDDPDTTWFGFIDLAYPQWKIAIEYDSEGHRLDRRRWQKDLHKNEVLHGHGWTVLRISIADIAKPGAFLLRLAAAVSRAEAA